MYDLNRAGESTYYMDAPTNIGFFVDESRVFLIDGGSDKDAAKKALAHITSRGWTLEAVICTHSHADHAGGCAFLREKTDCKIYAAGIGAAIIRYSYIEPTYLYGGFPIKDLRSKFIMSPPCDCEELTPDVLPEGLEYTHIDGHDFEQIAIKTRDGVWFVGDSVVSAETLSRYKIPFLYDIAVQLDTLQKLRELDGRLFIPAHCPPTEDITELARVNSENIRETAETIKRLCADGLTVDELLERLFDEFGIKLYLTQYALVGFTTRSYLSWLYEKGEIKPVFAGTKLLWKTAE